MKIVDRFGSRPGAELVRLPQGGERLLAVEHAAALLVNEQTAFRVVCTPELLPQLALGRLLTEGWIASADEVEQVAVCAEGLKVSVHLTHPLAAVSAAGQEVKNAITGNGDIEFKICYKTSEKEIEASKVITKEGVSESGEIDKLINVIYCSSDRIGIEDTYKKYLGDKIIIGKNCEYVFHYLNAHDEDQMDPDRDFVYDVEASKLTFGGQVSYWLDKIMGYHVKAREIEQTEFIQVLYSNDKVPFEMRPKNVGTGVTYITELIIAALACKANDLLVIENPEIHLHPSGQSELVEFLAFLAQCGVQIIVETHSDHIYNGIRKSIRLDQIDDDKVSIYSFEQDERGCSIPISIPINANGKALKNAEGFFDQINKDLDVILGW